METRNFSSDIDLVFLIIDLSYIHIRMYVQCSTRVVSSSLLLCLHINTGVPAASMWHETYFIRTSMLPSFLSPQLAKTILVIGKSINFMRACYQRIIGKTSTMVGANKGTVKTVLKNIQKQEIDEESPGEKLIRNRKSPEKKRGEPMAPPSMANALGGYAADDGNLHLTHTKNWDDITRGESDEMNSLWAHANTTSSGGDAAGDASTNSTAIEKKDEGDATNTTNKDNTVEDDNDGKNEEMGDLSNKSNPHENSWSPLTFTEMSEVEASLRALRYGGEMRLSELGTYL